MSDSQMKNPRPMRITKRRRPIGKTSNRVGAAVVEAAIVLPLIVTLLLGAMDVGQSVYTAQVINEASRDAARQAARFDTVSESEVTANIQDFVRESFVGMADSELTVNFADSSGNAVADGDLSNVESGATISVLVSLQYDSVRWIPGFSGLGGSTISTTTIMRRE
jgi:Flp pilus assembly protein TadG